MPSVFRPGERCGPYTIVRPLGEGGMGEVHLAKGPNGELRALKVLSPSAQQNRELTKRFMGEIQVLSYLQHAHVVRFYEAGLYEHDGRGGLWLALEYLEGRTLRQIVTAHPGQIPEDALLRWGRQIAQGVREAHKLNVIHRDLKPDNVLVVADDMAKVIDFGIAKFRDWGDTRSRTSGAKIGTILYMAPEQLDEALGIPIDARTDVYGVGVILYELALGRNPYVGTDGSLDMATLMIRKLAEDLPPLATAVPRVAPDLAAIVDRACAHDAAKRFPDMQALDDALGAAWRARMDERRANMLATPRAPDVAVQGGGGARASAPVADGAWHVQAVGPSARFDSVRTLPDVTAALPARHTLRDARVLGAMLGIASGLVVFRAAVEPRLARGRTPSAEFAFPRAASPVSEPKLTAASGEPPPAERVTAPLPSGSPSGPREPLPAPSASSREAPTRMPRVPTHPTNEAAPTHDRARAETRALAPNSVLIHPAPSGGSH